MRVATAAGCTFPFIECSESKGCLFPFGGCWHHSKPTHTHTHIYIYVYIYIYIARYRAGVFVNSAIKTREKDQETLLRHVQTFKQLVANLWAKIDVNGIGQISLSDFEELFQQEEMKAFFAKIEVDAVDCWTLFDSLDADGDHLVSYKDFSERCMQLHGTARSVDLFSLKQQTSKLWDELQAVEESQREAMQHLTWLTRAMASLLPVEPSDTSRSNELIAWELKWADHEAANRQ